MKDVRSEAAESAGDPREEIEDYPGSPTREIDPRAVIARVALRRAHVAVVPPEPDVALATPPPSTQRESAVPMRHVGPSYDRLVVSVADSTWAVEIQDAARIHPELHVEVCEPAVVERAARRVGRGVLLLDLDLARSTTRSIIDAWLAGAPPGDRSVILTGRPGEGRDSALALGVGARSWIRAAKPAILVVALVRLHLEGVH
jgi:hypothetical protein